MRRTLWETVTAVFFTALLSGCAPVIIGGAAAIVADEVIEQEEGGDGLF